MRNSREKYGETRGAKAGVYKVSGVFAVQEIGKQYRLLHSTLDSRLRGNDTSESG